MRTKLITLRKQKNKTQEEMAKDLGIARTTYNAYELGTTQPTVDIAIKIKEILKYKKDDIFLNENVSKTDKEE